MVNTSSYNQALARRKGLLAKVHIAKKDLAIPEEAYREILQSQFDAASAGDLTVPQLEQLVAHFERFGWQAQPKRAAQLRRRPDPRPESGRHTEELLGKVHALLAEIARLSEQYVPFAYAESILQRQYGVERLQWATARQLRGVISALNKRVDKLKLRAGEA